MPNHEQLLEIVDRDIREGIGRVFTPHGDIRLQAAFADVTLPDADVSFVPWEYDAVHDRPVHTTAHGAGGLLTHEQHGPPIVPATHRTFRILGVTVVDARTASIRLHRFVDWANVLAHVGMGMAMRPAAHP
jgi:hypothetical protein